MMTAKNWRFNPRAAKTLKRQRSFRPWTSGGVGGMISGQQLEVRLLLTGPAQPQWDLAHSAGRDGQIAVAWSKVDGAVAYDVYMTNAQTGAFEFQKNVTSTGYTATGLKDATSFAFHVVPVNSHGQRGTPSTDLKLSTLPATGWVSSYQSVALDSKQCVVAARAMAAALDGKVVPSLGTPGYAFTLWTNYASGIAGYRRVPFDANQTPPKGSLIVWNSNAPGYKIDGHVARMLGLTTSGNARIVEGNGNGAAPGSGKEKGRIRDVALTASSGILGYYVPV